MAFRVPERPVSNQPNITGDIRIDAFDHVATIVNIPPGAFDWEGVTVQKAGTSVGTQQILNIIEGPNVTATVVNNTIAGAIDITLESTGGGAAQSWADTLAVSKFSGPWNPHIDAPQYLSFGVEDVIPSVGNIRASGDLHLEANLDGYFHVLGSLFLGGHSSPNDATTIVSDIITLDATTNLVGTSDGTTTFTSVGNTVVSSTSGESILQAGTIARVVGATEAQLTAGTTARINGSDILLWSSDDFFLATGPGGSVRLAISDLGAWFLSGSSAGTAGQVLTSQGSASPPVWSTIDLSSVTYTAGDGIDLSGNVFMADVSDFAGTGLEDDGANNLRIASSAAGNGLTGGGGLALSVNPGNFITVSSDLVHFDSASWLSATGSASVVVSAGTYQRAALTGEVIAPQNNNSTTISRATNFTWTGQHVWQTNSDMWMSSTGGGILLNTLISGHPVGVPNGVVMFTAQGLIHADAGTSFVVSTAGIERLEIENDGAWQVAGNTGTSGQVLTSNGPSSSPSWQTVSTGSISIQQNSGTVTPNISTLNVIDGIRSTAAAVPVGTSALITFNVDVPGMASTSVINSSNTLQRAALTGEVTAPQNNNTLTIVRSTNFNWTGQHTFNTTGVFDVTAASDVNINGQGGAVFGSSASPLTDPTVGSAHIFADGLVRIFAGGLERVEFEPDGAWQVNGSTGSSGQLFMSQGSASSPVWATASQVVDFIETTLESRVMEWNVPQVFIGTLETFETVTHNGAHRLTGVQTVTTTGNINNLAIGSSNVIRFAGASAQTLTGMVPGFSGRYVLLVNAASTTLSIPRESGSSTASNRFAGSGGSSLNVFPGECTFAWYDGTSNRWRGGRATA